MRCSVKKGNVQTFIVSYKEIDGMVKIDMKLVFWDSIFTLTVVFSEGFCKDKRNITRIPEECFIFGLEDDKMGKIIWNELSDKTFIVFYSIQQD